MFHEPHGTHAAGRPGLGSAAPDMLSPFPTSLPLLCKKQEDMQKSLNRTVSTLLPIKAQVNQLAAIGSPSFKARLIILPIYVLGVSDQTKRRSRS